MEPDQACEPPSRPALDDAVEIDEEDGLSRAVRMGHAGSQAPGDEGEVRVGITRLDGALPGIQIVATLQPIMFVPCALGKQRPESFQVAWNVLGGQPRGEAAIEEPGCRVRRPIKAVRKSGAHGVFGGKMGAKVNEIESRLGDKLEGKVERLTGAALSRSVLRHADDTVG